MPVIPTSQKAFVLAAREVVADAVDIWYDGTYVYVARKATGVSAYSWDGSTLTFIVTQDDGTDWYNGLWGDGTYIYCACGLDGLRAYTFNGSTFTLKDTIDDGGIYRQVWGDGTYIYAANGNILAYSFIADTFLLKDSDNAGAIYYDVFADSSYIYCACGTDGVRAYSFNGTTLTLLDTAEVQAGGNSVAIYANGANVVYGTNIGLFGYIFNGSSFTGGASTYGYDCKGLTFDGTYFISSWGDDNGIMAHTFDGTTFTFSHETRNMDNLYKGVWADSSNIFVACDDSGVVAYNAAPKTISYNERTFFQDEYFYLGSAWTPWHDGTHLHVAIRSSGLVAIQDDTKGSMSQLDNIDDGGDYWSTHGDGTYIYAACGADGLRAYSWDGSDYTLLDTIDPGGLCLDVWTDGTTVFAAMDTIGVYAYTFDGVNFTPAGNIDNGDNYVGVWGDGTYIYCACFAGGIRAYSYNGSAFTLEDSHHFVSNYEDIHGDGTYIYAVSQSGGALMAYSFDGSTLTFESALGWKSETFSNSSQQGVYVDNKFPAEGDGYGFVYTAGGSQGVASYIFTGTQFLYITKITPGGSTFRNVDGYGDLVYATNSQYVRGVNLSEVQKPSILWSEQQVDPTNVNDNYPEFSAIFNGRG